MVDQIPDKLNCKIDRHTPWKSTAADKLTGERLGVSIPHLDPHSNGRIMPLNRPFFSVLIRLLSIESTSTFQVLCLNMADFCLGLPECIFQ